MVASEDGAAGDADGSDSDEPYRGIVRAIPYAIRTSDSTLFRAYGLVGTLVAVFVGLLFGLALVVLIGRTAGTDGGTFTLSRAFFALVGLFAVGPLLAPVLFVARRHRRDDAVHPRYDAALGLSGFLFVAALYVGLVVSTPATDQVADANPVVTALYALPRAAGLVPPLVVAVATVVVHRTLSGDGTATARSGEIPE
ncbi:MAG: hypothetical protein ABEJ79_12110 [Halolamina sp.]